MAISLTSSGVNGLTYASHSYGSVTGVTVLDPISVSAVCGGFLDTYKPHSAKLPSSGSYLYRNNHGSDFFKLYSGGTTVIAPTGNSANSFYFTYIRTS